MNTYSLPLQKLLLIGGILLLTFCSCSKLPSDLPKHYVCSLTITFKDGTPVNNAIVMMYPAEGKWYSNGKTDSSGKADMKLQGRYDGAAPGEYKVTVQKEDVEYPPGYDSMDENQTAEPKVTYYIDRIYTTSNSTPLKVTVSDKPVSETLTVEKFDAKKDTRNKKTGR